MLERFETTKKWSELCNQDLRNIPHTYYIITLGLFIEEELIWPEIYHARGKHKIYKSVCSLKCKELLVLVVDGILTLNFVACK
jgi:hypothetical protein